MRKRGRVTVVTSGHPSTCPRMVKAADALAAADFDVRLVSVNYLPFAEDADRDLFARRSWRWTQVQVSRRTTPARSRLVSARHRLSRAVVQAVGAAHAPNLCVVRAYGRTHPELVSAILSEPFDFIYGGTSGALNAIAEAARRAARPYALDLEDLHTGESRDADAALTHALARAVLRQVLPAASFVTTASTPMADMYAQEFGIAPLVLLNVCDQPDACPPKPADGRTLELYWFSQTIGPARGLEDVVRAAGKARICASFHLRGRPLGDYVGQLRALAAAQASELEIVVHPQLPPDALVCESARHHIGLSTEIGDTMNSQVCVSNKLLTYFAAGLAAIATATVGQRSLAAEIETATRWYSPGDVGTLATLLAEWNRDRESLATASRASAAAFRRRLHWSHESESGALLAAVEDAMP